MEAAPAIESNSDLLKAKIRLVDPRLREQLHSLWHHPRFSELFREHLFRLYHTVKASVPLLERSLERAQQMSSDCPVAATLEPYLERHIVEEKDHDEWLLDDLEEFGISRESVTSQIPPTVVATLIGAQYYYINHTHPVTVIAYLAVVEGNPPKTKDLDHVVATTDIPRAALRTFYKHADLDIRHGAEIWELIDNFPLTSWHHSLLGLSAMLCTELIAASLEEILAQANHK